MMIPNWATRVRRIMEVPAFEAGMNQMTLMGSNVDSLVPFRICAIGSLLIYGTSVLDFRIPLRDEIYPCRKTVYTPMDTNFIVTEVQYRFVNSEVLTICHILPSSTGNKLR